jgi:exosortase A
MMSSEVSALAIRELSFAARAWRLVALELAIVALVFGLLWPTTKSLILIWLDTEQTTYTHGFLVLAISLWLLVRDRGALLTHTEGSRPALMAICVLGALWLVCTRAAIQNAHQLLLLAILLCAIAAVFGIRVARRHSFAIGYLLYAMPIWGSFNDVLQRMTVMVSDLLLQATGVPAYVEGNLVHLPPGTFEIAGGCSGLHFAIVGLALGSLYGEVNRDSVRTRVKLVALALGFALLANYVRVYIVILAGYLTDMQHYLVQTSHYEFGWGVFAVMIASFFLIARRMPGTDAPAVGVAGSVGTRGLQARNVLLMLVALAIAPVYNVLRAPKAAVVDERPLGRVEHWSGPRSPSRTDWRPVYPDADRQQLVEYFSGSSTVTLFVAEYLLQQQGHELISWNNSLLGQDDEIVAARKITAPMRAVEWELRSGQGSSHLLWYFYRIGSRHLTSELSAQVWYGIDSLFTNPVSKVVALRAECMPDCTVARNALTRFVDAAKLHVDLPLSP